MNIKIFDRNGFSLDMSNKYDVMMEISYDNNNPSLIIEGKSDLKTLQDIDWSKAYSENIGSIYINNNELSFNRGNYNIASIVKISNRPLLHNIEEDMSYIIIKVFYDKYEGDELL